MTAPMHKSDQSVSTSNVSRLVQKQSHGDALNNDTVLDTAGNVGEAVTQQIRASPQVPHLTRAVNRQWDLCDRDLLCCLTAIAGDQHHCNGPIAGWGVRCWDVGCDCCVHQALGCIIAEPVLCHQLTDVVACRKGTIHARDSQSAAARISTASSRRPVHSRTCAHTPYRTSPSHTEPSMFN